MTEEEILLKIENYEYFLENMEAMVFVVSVNFELIYLNKYGKRFFGLNEGRINQVSWRSFLRSKLSALDFEKYRHDHEAIFERGEEKYLSDYTLENVNGVLRSFLFTGAISKWTQKNKPIESTHLAIDVSDKFDRLETLDEIIKENDYLRNEVRFMYLTKREIEVLRLISQGLSSQKISEALFINYETVKTHRKNIMKKLSINDITELVKIATESGMY